MIETLHEKRVLVTGADGFIGSHLVERLVQKGALVRAYVFYNSWNQIGWLSEINKSVLSKIEIFPGDIRDGERVKQAAVGCSYVFHLSSLVAIPYSYSAPRSYIDTNVIGTLNVLEACRESNALIRLVHVSTSEVYGTAHYVPIDEEHPLVGQSPYSASKIGADKMAESFNLSFGLPVVTVRPFNTFGPRQTARAVIPTIISQLLSGCSELKLGALHPTRDFNFVTDTADGMIALALCAQAEGQVVNIGAGEEWSIGKTAEILMEIIGQQVPVTVEQVRMRPEKSEVHRLFACTNKMKTLTGWERKEPFRKGLEITVDWIERNLSRFEPRNYSI